MEIKAYSSAITAYSANKFEKNQSVKNDNATTAKNTDKVEFSVSKVKNEQDLKSDIVKSVRESAKDDRINELKSLYSSGRYNVSSEHIAKSILGL